MRYLRNIILLLSFLLSLEAIKAQPGQVINSPTSSTVCTGGQTCTITWYVYSGNSDIQIQYQATGGSWVTIVENDFGQNGSYNWMVPTSLSTGTYRIRIGQNQTYYYAYYSYSDYFQINEAPYVDLTQPGAGTYYIGDKVNVNYSTNEGPVTLKLKNTVTLAEKTISRNSSNQWVIYPGQETGTFKIVAEGQTQTDESPEFTIGEGESGYYALNFVRSQSARVPVTSVSTFDNLLVTDGNKTDGISYVDGIGKARQSVSLYATPSFNHMVSPVTYNEIGQQTTSYKSYVSSSGAADFKDNAIERQKSFFDAPPTGVAANTHPFAKSVYEKSPLLTMEEQGAIGSEWQPGGGKTITTEKYSNNGTENVIRWGIVNTTTDERLSGDPKGLGLYPAGELMVNETTDEDGNTSHTYTNREGQEVLKVGYQDSNTPVKTYYVYDKYGNLRFIIPPNAVALITSNAWTLDGSHNDIRGNWLTEMKYDPYNRVVEKKIPEAGWVYTVYDRLGRVALTQDANMRVGEKNDWFFTKYDIRGRAVLTGVYAEVDPARQSRTGMQTHLDVETDYWETHTATTNFIWQHGYTNQVFPTSQEHTLVWSVTWYDDYDFDNDGTDDHAFDVHSDFVNPTGNNLIAFEADKNRTDGQVTGSRTLILDRNNIFEGDGQDYTEIPAHEDSIYIIGESITLKPGFRTYPGQKVLIGPNVQVPSNEYDPQYLEGVTFYDKYGNSIYTKSTNYVGGEDESWTLFKFDGLVAETISKHTSATENIEINNRFEYDEGGRLVKQYQKTGTQPERLISENIYQELGQLAEKQIYNNDGDYPIQRINYTYHQRGWLKKVNDPGNLSNGGVSDDVFAFELCYEDVTNCGGVAANAKYGGTITGMQWKKPDGTYVDNNNVKKYAYKYDGLNQLKEATFTGGEFTTGSFYSTYDYDLNGNITFLERTQNAYTLDELSYSYLGKGNQVTRIDDAIANTVTGGFFDGAETADEYLYDENGNMTYDANKGIDSILYNYMNLPELIIFAGGNKIKYLYDAAGTKLQQKTLINDVVGVKTDYSAGFVYENDILGYFPFSEGTLRKVGSTWRYEFNIADHLGNVRATYIDGGNDTAELIQADDYYPFGLKMPDYSFIASGADENKFTYNGKELEDEFGLNWYHYGLRFYDPVVGRWWATDPYDQFNSTYLGMGNTPINGIDPDGGFFNPIYSIRDGRLLGSDSKGYEGEAIFMDDDLFSQDMDHDVAAFVGTFASNFDFSGFSESSYQNLALDMTKLSMAIAQDVNPMIFVKPVVGNRFGLGPMATGAVDDITLETVSMVFGFGSLSKMAVTKLATSRSASLFSFASAASKHMNNPARSVPVQILDDVIKNTKGVADPQGSRALMHYSRIWKNGKPYNLEVLYDKTSNGIWHFQYTRKAIGPLQAIPK